jgi:hypothetical protein
VDLPDLLLQHEVIIEAYDGTDGYGRARYVPPVTERCFLDHRRRLVRAATGEEVVSESTVYLRLDATVPPESRVTLPDGRVATVIQALRRDGGELPVPSHLELVLT